MPDAQAHSQHSNHSAHLNPWVLGGVGTLSGLVLTPYILPLFGVGSYTQTSIWAHQLEGQTLASTAELEAAGGTFYGTGLAGSITEAIAGIPLAGPILTSSAEIAIPMLGMSVTAGALASLATVGVLAFGGMWLANKMEKSENPEIAGLWSKVVRGAALTTSVLVAMPQILGTLSLGITALAFAFGGNELLVPTVLKLHETIGAPLMGHAASAGTSLAAMLIPHVVTCGGLIAPLFSGLFFDKSGDDPSLASHAMHAVSDGGARADIRLVHADPVVSGQPVTLAFQVIDKVTGQPLSADELETTHTKKLHTMVVDQSLNDYHHLHPSYDPESGLFLCQFTPQTNHAYTAWHDYKAIGDVANVQMQTPLSSLRTSPSLPSVIRHTQHVEAGGLQVHIEAAPPLRAGQDSMLRVTVSDQQRRVVPDLAPVMGAYAHLVGFTGNAEHFIHCHPMGAEPRLDSDRGDGALTFHVTPEHDGPTKFFLQVRRGGQPEVTIPFGQLVRAPEHFAERVMPSSHAHAAALSI